MVQPKPAPHTPIFREEQAHLDSVLQKLRTAIADTGGRLEEYSRQYDAAKRYNAAYRHEIDPQEIFQNELALHDISLTGSLAEQELARLTALLNAPYFSSILFQEDGTETPESFYIGRFTFSYHQELVIFDWRSPVAGMFYDCEPGRAGYHAPACKIEGTLRSKRQFEINNGCIQSVFESAAGIRDQILQRELSRTADERMKTILSTLQKEQNAIIRKPLSKTLVIQGAAGSGKTSVALHRIAYLLYRHQRSLSARNILILSPNRVFSDYISGVLPELGEEPVYEMGFADIARAQLTGVMDFTPPNASEQAADAAYLRFLWSADLPVLLDRFLEDSLHTVFHPAACAFGSFTADAAWIAMRFRSYTRFPVKRRLLETANDILRKFQSDNIYEESLPSERTILKSLHAMLRTKDTLMLYRLFLQKSGMESGFHLHGKNTLAWADVFPFLYVHAYFEGLQESPSIKHLVIDEMQDYPPIFYAVINRLFPCSKTILGDFGQSLSPYVQTGMESMLPLYPQAEIVHLRKSYRSSFEIISFACQLQNGDMIEPVARHGEPVTLLQTESAKDELAELIQAAKAFHGSNYQTMGILVKTWAQADRLFAALQPHAPVHCITRESTRFHRGISICTVEMAKGLEFDAVIIPSACAAHYDSAHDRSLLFVACTRALHKLTILYHGTPSPLLPPST